MTVVNQRPIYSCDTCGFHGMDEDTLNWLVLPLWEYNDATGSYPRSIKHLCSVQCAGEFVKSINLTGKPISERKTI